MAHFSFAPSIQEASGRGHVKRQQTVEAEKWRTNLKYHAGAVSQSKRIDHIWSRGA
jgi:hypothetical protein